MKTLTAKGLGKMGNKYGIIKDGIIINICVGKPDNCVSVHLSGVLERAKIGDKIKDGQIIHPEPTELEIWKKKVRINREKTAENLKNHQYFTRKKWSTDNLNVEFDELHDEYEELKKVAPDGWTINKEGFAVI